MGIPGNAAKHMFLIRLLTQSQRRIQSQRWCVPEQQELRSRLALQAELVTPERFMRETRGIVHRVLG
jgi:hypothetical protein